MYKSCYLLAPPLHCHHVAGVLKSYTVFACCVCALPSVSLCFPFAKIIPDMLAFKTFNISPNLMYVMMMGPLAVLHMNAPGNNGRILPWRALDGARSGLADGPVNC